MQVILLEDVDNLGAMGDIVTVRDGYARNYLLPRKLAMGATSGRVRELAHKKRIVEDKRRKRTSEQQAFAKQLSAVQLEIPAKVGEDDRIFGTITNADVAEALAQKGYEIDRRKIVIEEPIRALGLYTVQVRLGSEVTAHVSLLVSRDTSGD